MESLKLGLEIHIRLISRKKLFSQAPNEYSETANVNVIEHDYGFPGTMPKINEECLVLAYNIAKVLNMKVNDNFLFDRKHYSYPDLP
jgi:aspartyl-tRNA(Asn)/glutamyl-tRNA(Gln) amidotransferase subunit B